MPSGYQTVFPAAREVELEEQEWGDPGPGQALVRMRSTLISTGTELTALSGDFPSDSRWARYIRYPWAPGYSAIAEIVAVGEDVKEWEVGQRVQCWARHASYGIISAESLIAIPEGVPDEQATFATLAEITMNALRRARLQFGESVAIVGAGLLGQLTAQWCRKAGAWPVIVIDVAEARLPAARESGATHTIAALSQDAVEQVQSLTNEGADVVFEVTGNPQAIPGCLKLSRRLGRVILLGSPRGPVSVDFHEEAHSLGLEIIGAHNSTHPRQESPNTPWTIASHTRLFLEWLAADEISVEHLISHRYSWRQAPEAFLMLLEDRSQAEGVILDWTAE